MLYIDKELKEHGLLQAIARTNRLADGKDYGLIVDYRGLIQKLDDAMNMYSGAGLENFEAGDLQGAIVDVITVVGKLRQAYTRLDDLFVSIKNKSDTEEVEVFLADDKKRETFYSLLCELGKNLTIVLNSEIAYQDIPKEERKRYQDAFIFYSKVRRSVKIRYCDSIDNSEYEPLMQNLLDNHLSVVGLKQITAPVDILNQSDFEKELDELGSLRSKADAIQSKMTKSISEKYDENPAYYDSFSKRIKDTLQQYKEKIITDAEYLEKMRSIMADYASGVTDVKYPEKLKNNVHAQAFYGVVGAILDDEIDNPKNAYLVAEESTYEAGEKPTKQDLIADIAIQITNIIEKHSRVDWTNNKTIHDRIAQDIDDLFYEYECAGKFKLPFDVIDKIIENVKTTALRRFKS